MGKCKINNVHSENSDTKARILKMCLPASPSFSVQEVFWSKECALVFLL